MTTLVNTWRRLRPADRSPITDAETRDAIDARLAAVAAHLDRVQRREREYRRFRDEYEARRPGGGSRE